MSKSEEWRLTESKMSEEENAIDHVECWEHTCDKVWKRSVWFSDKVTDHLNSIISMKLRGRNKLGVDWEVSGVERNGENVIENVKFAYIQEEVGQCLQLDTIFFKLETL